jgi:hypothetical protein
MDRAIVGIANRGAQDVIVSGANGTWTDAGIERAITRQITDTKQVRLTPKRAFGKCLGALLNVVIALEESQCSVAIRALVATLGWNQQAAAAMIERIAC